MVLAGVYDLARGRVATVDFAKGDANIDFSDPRLIVTQGRTYLTSISHLRLARSTDGVDFQIDPRDPDRMFANNYGGGNFLTVDGGQTWTVASKGYTGAQVRAIAVDPVHPARVYAAARSGLFTSADAGGTWVGLNRRDFPSAFTLEWNAVAVDPSNPQHVLAANNWDPIILRSQDGGGTLRTVGERLAEAGLDGP